MTTCAYKDGVLATDSCWTWGDTQTTSLIKVRRLSSGALLGGAGDNDDRAVVALLDKIKTFERLPSKAELAATRTRFAGLLVLPRGKVVMIDIEPMDEGYNHYDAQVWEANRGFAAIGSGSHYALGAMAAGKGAKEAVAIACRLDINSKPPVHSMALVPKR
jgi:ATP-dependent protease HslVU (ClpYQ) peptidase subunit